MLKPTRVLITIVGVYFLAMGGFMLWARRLVHQERVQCLNALAHVRTAADTLRFVLADPYCGAWLARIMEGKDAP